MDIVWAGDGDDSIMTSGDGAIDCIVTDGVGTDKIDKDTFDVEFPTLAECEAYFKCMRATSDCDGDGVRNLDDMCPNSKGRVDGNGCARGQVDPDFDGICNEGTPSNDDGRYNV